MFTVEDIKVVESPLDFLLHFHYEYFMRNPRFWYDKTLIEADSAVCIAASNLRKDLRNELAKISSEVPSSS